jgi:hypothetical protein
MVAVEYDGAWFNPDRQARVAPVAAGMRALRALRLVLAWTVVVEPDTGLAK